MKNPALRAELNKEFLVMKSFGLIALILVSLNAFAARNWVLDGSHTTEVANDRAEYRALRAKYPDIFIQEIDEARFYRAQVDSYGWKYIGNTTCESDDPRLETITHSSSLCMKTGTPIPLCAFSLRKSPKDEDPCHN